MAKKRPFQRGIYQFGKSTQDRESVNILRNFLFSECLQQSWYQTLGVEYVHDNTIFQKLGIDLLWHIGDKNNRSTINILVKSDKNLNPKNFAFETIGNLELRSRGSFLKSLAHWYFYYFPELGILYTIPLVPSKLWFKKNRKKFPIFESRSKDKQNKQKTLGRVVPIKKILREVQGVSRFEIRNGEWRLAYGPKVVSMDDTPGSGGGRSALL